jgi:peptide/nickel transport system substrate-binding protein
VNADSSLGTAVAISANAVVTLVLDIDNNEALQNEALRQAICYAIDKDSIGILGYGSLYSPAVGYLSSTNQFLVDGYTYEYNPEKAKQLVDDNGLAGTELTFVCPSGMQADMAEAMQAQLAEVGITLNIEVYDAATCISMWLEEGATSMMIDSATNANNDNNANTQWNNVRAGTDFPAMRKVDEKWNDLLDSALATADTDKQAELYAEFQQYEYDQYCAIPICEWCQAYCYGASGVIQSLDLTDVANPNFRVLVTNPVA